MVGAQRLPPIGSQFQSLVLSVAQHPFQRDVRDTPVRFLPAHVPVVSREPHLLYRLACGHIGLVPLRDPEVVASFIQGQRLVSMGYVVVQTVVGELFPLHPPDRGHGVPHADEVRLALAGETAP